MDRLMLRDPYGSNRSNRSGKSLSIFQDPNASQTLARDEEVTFNMYGGLGDNNSVRSSHFGAHPIGDRSSILSNASSKVTLSQFSTPAREEPSSSGVNPVELKGITYHNGVVGNGLESDIGVQRGDNYTSNGTGGIESTFNQFNSPSTEVYKPQLKSGTEAKVINMSGTTPGFLNEAQTGMNASNMNGLNTIELGSGDLDTVTLDTGNIPRLPGLASTTTKTTTTTREGPSTVTKTVTKTTTSTEAGSEPTGKQSNKQQVKVTKVTKTSTSKVSNDPRGGEKKVGSFLLKPASNWPLERSESTSSGHSTEFKTSLDDTLSRRAKAQRAESGEEGTLADTESLNTSRTNSMQRSSKANKVTRSTSGASGLSLKSGLTDNSSIPEDSIPRQNGFSGKRTDSVNSDLAQLVRDQDQQSSKPVSRASSKASQARATGGQQSNRSSQVSHQSENLDRYMRTIVSPVDTETNGGSTNEDTLDRLVREERSRRKGPSNRSSSASQTASSKNTTSENSTSISKTAVLGSSYSSTGGQGGDVMTSTKKSSAATDDLYSTLEGMTKEEGDIILTERVETKVEKQPSAGIEWFAKSGIGDVNDVEFDLSSMDGDAVEEDQITAAKKLKSNKSDPFSNLSESSAGTASTETEITTTRSVKQTNNFSQPITTSTSVTHSASVSTQSSASGKDVRTVSKQTRSTERSNAEVSAGRDTRIVSPIAAAAKSDEFKSKLSSMMQSSNSGDSSASSPVAIGKNKHENITLNINQGTSTNINEVTTTSDYQTSSLPRDQSNALINSATTPTSPIEDVRTTVREGTVGKIKHAFKDFALTGGLAPSTLERNKQQTDTSGTESETGTGPKKFKFAIEGIDVPAPEQPMQQQSGTDTSPSTLTRDGQTGIPPPPLSPPPPLTPGSPSEFESSDADTLERKSLERKKRGFSYLLDAKLAGEIKKRADNVQSRKPHEALQAKQDQKSQITEKEEESGVLKEARAKLQHKDLFQEIKSRNKPVEEESGVLKEARAKLQHHQTETQQTPQMAQPPASPSPIQAHMLLAQRARLQKRSTEEQPGHENSTAPIQAESNRKQFASKIELPVLKKTDPVPVKHESKVTSRDVKQVTNTSTSSTQITRGKVEKDVTEGLVTKTKKKEAQSAPIDFNSSLLRSASTEKRNSQTFTAKKLQENVSVPGDRIQLEEKQDKPMMQTTTVTGNISLQATENKQTKTTVEVDSPDSAYQSDAPISPGVNDLKPLIKQSNKMQPPLQEVEVRYAKQEPVPSTSRETFESKHSVVKEVKSSSKMTMPNRDGRPETIETQKSQKSEYNALTKPDVKVGQPQLTTKSSYSPTNTNKEVRDGRVISDQTTSDRREDVKSQVISQQDIINAALNYKPPAPATDQDHTNHIDEAGVHEPTIDSKRNRPAANQPSTTEFTASQSLPRPGNKIPQAQPVQIKVTAPVERSESTSSHPDKGRTTPKGPYTFVVPVTLDSADSSPRYVTDGNTGWVQGQQREAFTEARPRGHRAVTDDQGLLNTTSQRRRTSRQESFNSTSTYTTQSSIGSSVRRVIPLMPISVDVDSRTGRQRRREMKTHPHSPGLLSPTRNTNSMSQPRSASQPRHSRHQKQQQQQNKMRQPQSKSHERGRRERSRTRDEHLEVNIFGEEDGDSTPSPHSPPNRYLKVEEGRTGRVPRYRMKDISVRNGFDSGHEYHSSAEFSPRGKKGPHVSNIHVEGDYIDYDSGSAYSEPARYMGRSAGKYSIQKISERRGLNHVPSLELHPDNTYKKQRMYTVQRDNSFASNRSGMNTMRSNVHDSTLRSVNTHTMASNKSGGGPDIAAVDPDLLGANKTGKEYNVSLKLNAMIGSRPGSKMSWEHDELNQAANVSQYENEYRQANGHDQTGRYVSTVMNYDDYNDWDAQQFDANGQRKDGLIVTSVRRNPGNNNTQHMSNSRHRSRSVTDTREVHHQQFRQVAKPRDRVDIDIELAPEDYAAQTYNSTSQQSFQRNTRLRRSLSDPSMAKKFQNSELEPKFSMTINQTMTMDYTPQDGEEEPIDDNNNRRRAAGNERPPPQRRKQQPRRQQPPPDDSESDPSIDEQFAPRRNRPVEAPPAYGSPSDSDETVDEPMQRARNKMNERPPDPQWPDDDDYDDGQGDDMPNLVRGSILIKNTIDTVGKPRVIDVVDGEDSDDDYLVEDNTNLFDNRFLQSRTNPLYDSDNEDSQERPHKPRFTDIFQSEKRTVNGTAYAAPKSSSRKTKSRARTKASANGYDDPDAGFEDMMTKTTTYNVRAETGSRSRGQVKGGGGGGGGGGAGSSSRSGKTVETKTEWHINKLLAGAPPDSIKQTINVEREEEEIMGPLPANHADGSSAGPDGLLNFDTVSEKVDLGMLDGKAQVAVKVRCERIVPIRGVDDMFKKSSVIVTRLIEIDLTATDERRRLYEHIMRNQNRPMITSGDGAKSKYKGSGAKLSTKETFKLYKTFMGLAEADEAGQGQTESLQIDRNIDEQRRPDLQSAGMNGLPANLDEDEFDFQGGREFDPTELEQQMENDILPGQSSKVPEPDTISYMSAASSVQDILY